MILAALTVARCLVPDGAAIAATRLADGTEVVARPGALEVGGVTLTPCDGLPEATPTALAPFAGGVAVGFHGGAALWAEGRFTAVGPRLPVRALAAAEDALWIGTSDGLWRYAGGRAARIGGPLGHGEISALGAGAALEIGAGARGLWRLAGDGVARRVERGRYVGCFTPAPQPPGPACAARVPARTGSGLASGHVTALAEWDGSLWVGTFDRGLARRGADGSFVAVAGLPPFINALAAASDGLYVATPKGLYRVGAGGVERVVLGGNEHVNALHAARDGTLWIATSGGLLARDAAGLRTIDEAAGLPGRIAYAVAETDDGAIWVGTQAGVARLAPAGVVRYSRASGALPHDWVTALLPDGDGVLAGTYDAGVWRLGADGRGAPVAGLGKVWVNPAGLARLPDGSLAVATLGDGLLVGRDRFAAVPGLPSADVTAVVAHGAEVWIGTRGGLAIAAP